MKKSLLSALTCLFLFIVLDTSAQNFQVEGITRVNLGDGRWLHRELESETPLEGRHRIIDGYRSEYVEAVFASGLYNGVYEAYKHNMLVEKGTYSEGRKHGLFTKYTSDGKLESETPYTAGRVDGVVKSYYTDGSLQKEKGWKNGQEYGTDRSWKFGETEPSHDWNFREGKKDGRQFTLVRSNQAEYSKTEHYKMGVLSGEYLESWSDGSIKVKGSYENGKEVGVWVSHRRNGKQDGYMTFRDGLKHGLCKTFFDDGSVSTTTEWANDKREGVERAFSYENGELTSEFRYSEGVRNGLYKRYYGGVVQEDGMYEKGEKVLFREYYSDGQLSEVWRLNERGRLVMVEGYERDGTPIEL